MVSIHDKLAYFIRLCFNDYYYHACEDLGFWGAENVLFIYGYIFND